MTLRAKLFHPATAIALLALVVAAGGTGWAATLVGTAQLRAGAVTTAKLAPGSVTTPKIKAGAVTSAKLARGAVQGAAIFDGAITERKLSRAAVGTLAIAPGAVGAAQIADGAITTAKLADGVGTPATLADGAVTTAKLADGAVTGAKVVADAITADKIADGQVVEGAGALLSNLLTLPVGAGSQLLNVTGFGSLSASCSTGVATLRITNATDATVNVETLMHAPMNDNFAGSETLAPGAGLNLPNRHLATGVTVWRLQLSYTDAAGRDHVATVETSAGLVLGAGFCTLTAQGLTTG